MKLQKIRAQIDEIDRELLRLIEERMGLAMLTRRYKTGIKDNDREAEVMATPKTLGLDLVTPEMATRVMQTLMEESRRLQAEGRKMVAFQGERGAYGELAARELVTGAAYIPCRAFADVFQGVEEGHYDLGAVPVENSIEGPVTEVNELLSKTQLHVVGEADVPIHHSLLAPPRTDHRDVRVVYSHPQALAQCREFLQRARIEPRPYYNTAGAARMIARERLPGAAAIASSLSADIHGLEVLVDGIEDSPRNATRFILLAKQPAPRGDKCSIFFTTEHKAGELHEVLRIFADAQINLTRISSLPVRSDPGSYCFFLDLIGSDSEEKIQTALKSTAEKSARMRLLGCYQSSSHNLSVVQK